MDSLVVSNVQQRPTRTAVSILGVALGVVLVLIFVGLVNGMQHSRAQRDSNVGADIMFCREFSLSPTSLPLPTQYQAELNKVPGVTVTTPVGQYLKESKNGIGFEVLEGIDFPSYAKMSGITMKVGQPLQNELDVIVDEDYAKHKKVTVGSEIELFNRKFKVSGIYQPESGARIKINLASMQKILSSPERCTVIYVKGTGSESQASLAKKIDTALPGNKIMRSMARRISLACHSSTWAVWKPPDLRSSGPCRPSGGSKPMLSSSRIPITSGSIRTVGLFTSGPAPIPAVPDTPVSRRPWKMSKARLRSRWSARRQAQRCSTCRAPAGR